MVTYSPLMLDSTFAALADPTRRAILERLAQGEASVTEVSEPFSISRPAISKHIRVLEEAGLVARRKEGRVHHLSLQTEPMRAASDWLAIYRRFWESSLDALGDYLDETESD